MAAARVNLPGAAVILVGAGENAALAAAHLAKRGIAQLEIVSRTIDHAAALCAQLKMGRPHTLNALPELVGQADLILCSTASQTPIITASEFAYLFSQRTKPWSLSISPSRVTSKYNWVSSTASIYSISKTSTAGAGKSSSPQRKIPCAEQIISDHVKRYNQWLDSLNIKDVISELMNSFTKLAETEARRYSGQFDPAGREQLERFAVSLVKKVLHGPIHYLKKSEQEELVWDQLQAAELIRKMLLETERKGHS
jgi:glutamyl-tRNA reductase